MKYPDKPTFGNTLGPAVQYAVRGQLKEAQEWFDLMVKDLMERGVDGPYTVEKATKVIKSNIGYFAGYYGETERRAVADVYGAIHPIFGNDFSPSADKAFEAGKRMANGEF